MTETSRTDLPEKTSYLVLVAIGPAIWMAHFLVSYAAVSIWCSKIAGPAGTIDGLWMLLAILTIAALLGLAAVGLSGHRRHRHGSETPPHDSDTPGDRHRFLGFATMLLAGLSAVATIYSALAFVLSAGCR